LKPIRLRTATGLHYVRTHHVLKGNDISTEAVEDAIKLSEENYCPVGAMAQKSAEFHTTFEVVPAAELVTVSV
jgi:uncharacterized OsmC-like protein